MVLWGIERKLAISFVLRKETMPYSCILSLNEIPSYFVFGICDLREDWALKNFIEYDNLSKFLLYAKGYFELNCICFCLHICHHNLNYEYKLSLQSSILLDSLIFLKCNGLFVSRCSMGQEKSSFRLHKPRDWADPINGIVSKSLHYLRNEKWKT